MATAKVVHLYLPVFAEAASTTEWIHALSIPREDIERLTLRPLKWLRFATFSVCGAKGDLSATPGGEIVDYENVSFDNLADTYYYIPDGMYHLVDCQALDDSFTSSATQRRADFREAVCRRDNTCVITQRERGGCEATHIIPHSKGSDYITYVVRDRSSIYEQLPFALEDDIDIDCVENGILLEPGLHVQFGQARVAFLKTPNFAMVPADVPRIEQASTPHNRTSLQHMKPPIGSFFPWGDIQADWSRDEVQPPPSILLDFMYGAAVVEHWKCDQLYDMLQTRFENDFSKVLAKAPTNPKDDEPEVAGEPDDPKDPTWVPRKGKQKARKRSSSDGSAGLLDAMDAMLMLSMLLKGTTPQSIAAEQDKRDKEKELRSREHSSEKVRQWLNSDSSTRPL